MTTKFTVILFLSLLWHSCKKAEHLSHNSEDNVDNAVRRLDIADAVLLLNIPDVRTNNQMLAKLTRSGELKPLTFRNQEGEMVTSHFEPNVLLDFDGRRCLLSQDTFNLLVDKTTGEVTEFPKIKIDKQTHDGDHRHGYIGFQADKNQNKYYYQNGMVYKLTLRTVNDAIVEEYIPNGQVFDKFIVDSVGNCLFGKYFSSLGDFKIKLVDGRLIVLTRGWFETQLGFSFINYYNTWLGFDGNFYLMGQQAYYSDKVIVQLRIQNGHVEAHRLTQFSTNADPIRLDNGIYTVRNPIRQSIIFPGHLAIGEFDEVYNLYHEYPHVARFMNNDLLIKKTKSACYIANKELIIRVSLENYAAEKILETKGTYEIGDLYTSEADDELFFTALRYADGRRVLGQISDRNTVIYDEIDERFEVIGKL